VLTMHHDADLATRALRAGASGFLLKHSAGEELLNAIQQAIEETIPLSDQESDYQSDQVIRLLKALRKSQRSALDLMRELGLVHRPTFRKNYLHPALAKRLIEMTQPDIPKARNQKYRLTERGKRLIEKGKS